jgi:hypothetical protein
LFSNAADADDRALLGTILFEGIAPEMILSRRFKADLGIYHRVFDRLESAIALFSEAGKPIFKN